MKNYNCVLLVDDDPIANFINHTILTKLSLTEKIAISRDGREALKFLREYEDQYNCIPELILVDIKMPIMNGFEFLEEFEKAFEELKEKTRVIILSNIFTPQDVQVLKEIGHSDFLNKPLQRDLLVDILEENFYLEDRA
ncbi:MAG: response regulator [Cytophagaceae bacterium]